MLSKDDPLSTLVVGVDEPWEVCLVKLMVELVGRSAAGNMNQLQADPQGQRHAVEAAFRAAAHDPSRIQALGSLLEETGLFSEFQDRFFALVRGHRGSHG